METQTNLTLGQYAQTYKSESTKNVTELEVLNINYPISQRSGTDDEGKAYSYTVVEFNHEDYRLPKSVIKAVQEYLKQMPTLKNFKVTKSGEGLKTKYTVIPIIESK